MKKEIRVADEQRGIVQITTADERWYVRETKDETTGLPAYEYVPSVTWITGHYPKGIAFYKWLAEKGWDESQAIKQAAGNKGSKVHQAITTLLEGREVPMDAQYVNHSTGALEELTLEEYDCLMAFVGWYEKAKPTKILANEIVVWDYVYGFAGTVDLVAEIDGELWIIDFKTSQYVGAEYEMQVSAYKHALQSGTAEAGRADYRLAILQIGYRKNKAGWKWTEVEDKLDLFLAARQIWQNETAGQKPLQRDYPLALKIDYQGDLANDNNGDTRRPGSDEQPGELPAPAAPRAERGVAERRQGAVPKKDTRRTHRSEREAA